MSLFKIVDGELIILKEEVMLHRALHTVLRRDKDRFKKQAFKELAYIYFVKDPDSPVFKYGMNEQESHKYAIDKTNMPNEWTVDEVMQEALKEYEYLTGSIVKDVIREALITFRNYIKILQLIRKHIDKLLKEADEHELTVEDIGKLMSYTEQLLKVSNAIPEIKDKLYNSLRIVEKNINITNETELVRGTAEPVPDSYNPNSDY